MSRDTKSYLPLLLPVLLLTLSLTSSGIPSKRVLIPQWIAVSRLAVVVEIVQKVLKIRFAVCFFFHEKTKTHRGLIPNVCLKRRGFLSTQIIRKKLTFRAWWTLKRIIIKAEIAVYKLLPGIGIYLLPSSTVSGRLRRQSLPQDDSVLDTMRIRPKMLEIPGLASGPVGHIVHRPFHACVIVPQKAH